jgi:excisionase family DNA binding protein
MKETTVLTIPEVAKLLRISEASAYNACARGDLPSVRVGALLRVPRVALDRWLDARTGRRKRRPWTPPEDLFEDGAAA